jgi:hypothetical protein
MCFAPQLQEPREPIARQPADQTVGDSGTGEASRGDLDYTDG